VDLCDDVSAPVPFSCRSATCGTCRVEILEGDALFAPPDADERQLLAELRGPVARPAVYRLACQAEMLPIPGQIALRPAGDYAAEWAEAERPFGAARHG